MARSIKGSGRKMREMVRGSSPGRMVESTKASGRMTSCMGKENIKMGKDTKGRLLWKTET